MKRTCSPQRQRGAVIVTVALMMLFLLGFMGFALDFGRLFVVRTELQTAMDSCSLAAAQELDEQPTSITRAVNAGLTAGNLNRVNFQSADWAGQGQLTATDLTFRNATYDVTTDPLLARYAQCQYSQPNIQMFLMTAMGAFNGDTATFPATRNVAAAAVATRVSAQTACAIPVALRPKTAGAGPPNYGYTPGEWVTMLMTPGPTTNGYIGWANLDGSNSASETERELKSQDCTTVLGDDLGTPGVQASVADVWNARFGLYRGSTTPATPEMNPDFTGYAYTTNNWPTGANAYTGATPPGAHATAANFVTKRLAFASCADTGTQMNGPNGCRAIINRTVNSFNRIAPPGATANGGHREYGTNRRIVTVPVTLTYPGSVDGFACMLLLQPISIPPANIQMEYLGNASASNSPCVTSSRPGGVGGPLVPALVR